MNGAFLNRAVTGLIETRGMSQEELNYAKFRLRTAIEQRIRTAKRAAMRKVYASLLLTPAEFTADGRCEMIFQHGRYAYDWPYAGFTEIPRHFFRQVEYKNTRDWDLPDNIEKPQLGELWERRSEGEGLFIMPCGKDWAAIRAKMIP